MFDVDGTLVQSMDFDPQLFATSIEEEIGIAVDRNWSRYSNVTDAGILDEILKAHDFTDQQDDIEKRVKDSFFNKMEEYLHRHPAQEVKGASSFLEQLISNREITKSIATGGWHETTLLKLRSADLLYPEIPIASSSDHCSRTEIMKISKERSGSEMNSPCTYFGDAAWDKVACEKLNYNFVLVGSDKVHDKWIPDFTNYEKAIAQIGL